MYRVGIDVGGTFTDLFCWDLDDSSAPTREAKVLSTPEDPSIGFMDALAAASIEPSEIESIIHGTTIATNALITRRYPEPALVTTKGFRDVIEVGRQRRKHLYHPYQVKTKPIISRSQRFEALERMSAAGTTIDPLDRDEARRTAERIAALGIENVAVAFINAYRNGEHEREMAEVLREVIPDARIALSSETRPKMRELGRFTTTAVRAALLPIVGSYIDELERKLHDAGIDCPLYIVKSNGGMMRAATAAERPEEMIESGPAGGIAAGSFLGQLTGAGDMIVTDVGGTSFEASLMQNGEGLVVDEYEIEWERPIITPMLDIRSIGAGGGSIAWIDAGGSLRVGPQSAGAAPGPACYGRGGTEPTVTDANLVLGRIDPTLGGKFDLDAAAAEAAIESIASPLGMSVLECAEGITEIVSENMASAIRMVSTDRGLDPRDHTLLAFGGAGGLHAQRIAESVGIQNVIIPRFAGVACAFGATTMDIRHDLEATFYSPTGDADLADLNAAFVALEGDVKALLEADGVDADAITLTRSALMRYVGQSYDVATPVPSGVLDAAAVADVASEFHNVHRREYGVASESFDVAFVTLRVTGVGLTVVPNADALRLQRNGGGSLKGTRTSFFDGSRHEVEVHDAALLTSGQRVSGPALIEQQDGVIVVPPGAVGEADDYDNVVITREENN